MTSGFKEFIEILRRRTPEGINTVDMLTEIIPMSKEAAYRRLRGEIDFSFEEIMKISKKMDISLDSLNKYENKRFYKAKILSYIREESFMEDYILRLETVLEEIMLLKKSPDHYILSVNNNISVLYLYKYRLVSKLRVYKWMYQRNTKHKSIPMSEFVISPKAIHLEKMILKEFQQTRFYFIYGQELIKSLINDINYFHHLNLISEEEVKQMKEEASVILSDMEHDAILGKNEEISCTIHVTNVNFDTDFIMWESNKISKITFRLFGVNFFVIDDPDAIREMKNWTNMLLKSSTQISFSGEKKRMEFFQNQRKELDRL